MIGLEVDTWQTIIGTGGWVGAAGVIAFIGKQLIDSWLTSRAQKREAAAAEKAEERGETSAAVGNMSSVNATLTKSIETLAAENDRLQKRNIHLEGQVDERDKTIETLKAQLLSLSDQAQRLAAEVTTYQLRLREQDHTVD